MGEDQRSGFLNNNHSFEKLLNFSSEMNYLKHSKH